MTSTIRKGALTLLAGLTLLGACKEATSVGDLNAISAEGITAAGLTRPSMQLLVTGLLDRQRGNTDVRYLVFSATLDRDIYRIDPAENRFITELIGQPADPGGFVGGGVWAQFYYDIRTANILLGMIDDASKGSTFTAGELAGARGFVRTMKAIDYWRIVALRDTLGAPIDVNRDVTGDPAPFVCKTNELAFISALLDSAATDLKEAGTTPFPFNLPGGFSLHGDFTTPAAILQFNRGLAGKVDFYRGMDPNNANPQATFTEALAELDSSFLSLAPADTAKGIYYTFSTAAGETQNPIVDPAIRLNPSFVDSLMPGDLRAAEITPSTKLAGSGVSSSDAPTVSVPTISSNLTRPIPMLENSELVLLRAQVEIELGDLVSATRDINYTHVNEGGLPAYPVFTNKQNAISAVLYEKRYSLFFTGPQRLVDLRAYGRYNANYLPTETVTVGDVFQSVLPIPQTEVNAHGEAGVKPTCQ